MAARLFGPETAPELKASIMAMMLATNPAGAAAAARGRAERPDYQPTLTTLRVPALVLTGDPDSYSTAEITRELAGCLPAPEVVLLKGVGHLPNLEQPDKFDRHLLSFLTRSLP
jgi:pimeloyl-ACP methyl ester carboxylesterase